MNILCFSDLHIRNINSKEIELCQHAAKYHKPDVIVISGDVCDNKKINVYEELSKIYLNSVPIVFTLGNHEFAYSNISDTLKRFRDDYNSNKYNVHCLDIIGHKCVENFNFVGNVLWYDGSLRDIYNQRFLIDEDWLDSTIYRFNFREENKKCVEQINAIENHPEFNDNEDYDNGIKIEKTFLITHCVPHIDMNLWSLEGVSRYNMYSGMKDLFSKLSFKVDYSICGHTHRYCTKEIDGCYCVNIGNDYLLNSNGFRSFYFEDI